ncbi:MAG: tail fiber domain-containing protein, partial [Candidatus Fonsibacter sp.]
RLYFSRSAMYWNKWKKTSFPSRGVYIGLDSASAGGIEICTDTLQYIDFFTPASDYRARIFYYNSSSDFINASLTVNMTLNTTGLTVNGTITPSSDSRLKFNAKSLTNGLVVINKLEPMEYDQIYELVDHYTTDAPQSYQCGCIAQSVEQIYELINLVVFHWLKFVDDSQTVCQWLCIELQPAIA